MKFLYKYLYKDERSAHGIFNSMSDDLVIDFKSSVDVDGYPKEYWYSFDIDGFSINIKYGIDKTSNTSIGSSYKVYTKLTVDDLELKCSKYIRDKIFSRGSNIYCKEEIRKKQEAENNKREEERMLRKDIKIRFGK